MSMSDHELTQHSNKNPLPKEKWSAIKALAEQGVPLTDLAKQFPISIHSIKQRSSKERWLTPQRICKAQLGKTAPDDPANAVAALWKQRSEDSRELIHNGMASAIKRFLALSPVPQSFQEVSIAKKLLDECITPKSEQDNSNTLNLAILTQSSFKPQSVTVVDVEP
jgi:hypothetical protein